MPKGSSGGGGGGGNIPSDKLVNVKITNEITASGKVVSAFTSAKNEAVRQFPELEGQIYNELNKVTVATMKPSNTSGVYKESQKKITINKNIVKNPQELKKTMAHEVGHALQIKQRKGFNDVDTTFKNAYSEYKRSNPRATELSFANKISRYATRAKSEAMAEAFKNVLVYGKKANAESKLLMKHWRK